MSNNTHVNPFICMLCMNQDKKGKAIIMRGDPTTKNGHLKSRHSTLNPGDIIFISINHPQITEEYKQYAKDKYSSFKLMLVY